jgi:hypothetical protein
VITDSADATAQPPRPLASTGAGSTAAASVGGVHLTEPGTWFVIRPPDSVEMTGIYEAWAGTWKRSRAAGCIPNHLFEKVTGAAITQLLERGMEIRVLAAATHPGVLLGWVAFERDRRADGVIVHYLFTREPVRQRGIAKLLLADIGAGDRFIYTHKTGCSRWWPRARHNPGAARRKEL